MLKQIIIRSIHRKHDLEATYIVNADGEAMLSALIAANYEQDFGDWTRTVERKDVREVELNEAKQAAFITLYGEPDKMRPWRHISGNFCPLGNLCDRINDETGKGLDDCPEGGLAYVTAYFAKLASGWVPYVDEDEEGEA